MTVLIMYAKKIQDPLPNLGISQAYMITTITIAKKPHPKGLVLSSNLEIQHCCKRKIVARYGAFLVGWVAVCVENIIDFCSTLLGSSDW